MIPYSKEAHQLFHKGALAFAEIEHNGMRIDTEYLKRTIKRTARKIKRLENQLSKSEIMKEWRKVYKEKTNINSSLQLGHILFEVMKFYTEDFTATGKHKTDEKTLGSIDHPFVKNYLEIKKLQKALSTYLIGIDKEVVDEYIHPVFNLHTVSTYRSSSDSPNFQNIPIRNEKIGRLIRKAFIARPDRRLVEIDYAGIEVCIASCYHKDPTMIGYIKDKTKDMHRDMAMECYKLSLNQMTKQIRYCGKNMFVFPQFYGDWYADCAQSLWEALDTMKLKTAQGIFLKDHLKMQGIKKLGDKQIEDKNSFMYHIQHVERNFWERRFPIYNRWKKEWYEEYKDKGWFLTKTGFICQGFMKKNEVINYPVQGSAFHCLLWALIELINSIRKRKMETLIVGQIHDSIIADVPENELIDFLNLAREVMIIKLMKEWKWINVPLEIEVEASDINGSWADKKEVKNGIV